MFRSLRQNSSIYVLNKDTMAFSVGSVTSISNPVPKYQMQSAFGQNQEMVVDINAKVNNQDLSFQKISADLDIIDSNVNGLILAASREAMNSEIMNIKKHNADIVNNIDKYTKIINRCDEILIELNPEFAEKQAQQQEISELKSKLSDMSNKMESLLKAMETLKKE